MNHTNATYVDDLRALSSWLTRIIAPLSLDTGAVTGDLLTIRGPDDGEPGVIEPGTVKVQGDGWYDLTPTHYAIATIMGYYTTHMAAYRHDLYSCAKTSTPAKVAARRAQWDSVREQIDSVYRLIGSTSLSTAIRMLRGIQAKEAGLSHTVEIDGERFTVIGLGSISADLR